MTDDAAQPRDADQPGGADQPAQTDARASAPGTETAHTETARTEASRTPEAAGTPETEASAEATKAGAASAGSAQGETYAGPGASPGPGSAAGAAPPPWGATANPPPPPFGSAFTHRYGLVRPYHGRYLAGVCAGIGNATNTDPTLWRVLLAVLGFAGGIGILIYLAAWLIIPNEGDTASPVESMLGRGSSSMSPVLVIILSLLVAMLFAFIVTDKFRAMVLGAAIVIGGALLLNRNSADRSGSAVPPPTGAGHSPSTPESGPASAGPAAAAYPGPAGPPPYATRWIATPSGYSRVPMSPPPPPRTYAAPPSPPRAHPASPGGPTATGGFAPYEPAGPTWRTYPPAGVPPAPPYRPPFAPHGPYANRPPQPPSFPPPPPPPPRAPKERSRLGALTFSMVFLVLGVVAALDLSDAVAIPPSGYFAAALVTIAFGLLVGTWFGRARWLIALGLVTAAALGVTTVVENYVGIGARAGDVAWRPTSYEDLADNYSLRVGDAVLDLSAIDFTGREAFVRARVDFGELRVILPPDVDAEVRARVDIGEAQIFETAWSGFGMPARIIHDLGVDGRGGGKLQLVLQVNTGRVEVLR